MSLTENNKHYLVYRIPVLILGLDMKSKNVYELKLTEITLTE